MRKIYTFTFAIGLAFSSTAQVQPLKQGPEANKAYPNKIKDFTGFESLEQFVTKPQPLGFNQKAINETVIGETVYDLQSNSSIQNRNLVHADGSISAGFTFGSISTAFPDRGTGYNYNAGTWGANPTARVETTRSGWPSLMYTTGGTEAIISHAGSGAFQLNARSTKGTGTWTQTTLPNTTGHWMLWPRAASGGANGNSIHCIGITAPIGNGGTAFQGIDGALLYYRSTDEGATWDIVDSILPGLDSTKFNRFRADAYSIISDGDNVAIGTFNQWGDMILLKSTDNGDTWTTQIVNDFPLDLYVTDQPNGSDTNGDLIPDTLETCDESGSILFDQNGMVHMTFGRMRVLDSDLTDGNTSYFPGTQELLYWNENMGTGNFMTIAVPEDIDGDLQLGFAGDFALYYTSLCSFSNLGINANGTIFVSYAGYREDFFTTDQNFRHIYVTKTYDGGTTWEPALDVTPDPFFQYYECVFPTMASNVTDKVRLHYMRDFEPGLAVRGDMDVYDLNEIIYLEADTNLINDLGMNELSDALIQTKLFPNPSNSEVTLSISLEETQSLTLSISDINGKKTRLAENKLFIAGDHDISIPTQDLASGTYFINLEIDGRKRTEKLIVKH